MIRAILVAVLLLGIAACDGNGLRGGYVSGGAGAGRTP